MMGISGEWKVIIIGYGTCYFLWVECYHFCYFDCFSCGKISSFLDILVDLSVKLHVILMVLFRVESIEVQNISDHHHVRTIVA
jgi:hypothetical protein